MKIWQGIAGVSDISLAGWLVSADESAAALTYGLALAGLITARLVEPNSSSPDCVADKTDGDTMSLDRETISAIAGFLVILMIVYIAWDAGRDKDKK